jgi:hypothetical protein
VITIAKKTESKSKFQDGYYFSLSNKLGCDSAAELSKHVKTELPIDQESVLNDEWHQHPNQFEFPVMVNTAGTHVYNTKTDRFVLIHRYKSKYGIWVDHKVSVNSNVRGFQSVIENVVTIDV